MKRVLLALALGAPLLAQNVSVPEAQSFQARDAGKGDEDYQKGLTALDSHDWEAAIAAFDESASQKKSSARLTGAWSRHNSLLGEPTTVCQQLLYCSTKESPAAALHPSSA